MDYKPEAIDAAQKEIESRNLSSEQLEEARKNLEYSTQKKSNQEEQFHAVRNRFSDATNRVLSRINPAASHLSNSEKIIRLYALCALAFSLYHWYVNFHVVQSIFRQSSFKWESYFTFLSIPMIFLPIGSILLFKGRKIGWFITSFAATYFWINVLFNLYNNWNYEPSGFAFFDQMYPPPSRVLLVKSVAIFTATLVAINIKPIRQPFKISNKVAVVFFLVSILCFVLLFA